MMHKMRHIIGMMSVLASMSYVHPSWAATGAGEMGVDILENVLSFDKDKAEKFCNKRADHPNCDIVIANDTIRAIRPMMFSTHDDKLPQTQQVKIENTLINGDYPIRMVNFE